MTMDADIAFFYEHVGYSCDPKTQTEEQSRLECAAALARAEETARRCGDAFQWFECDTTSQEFSYEKPYYQLWACVMHVASGPTVYGPSLHGIDFGRGGEPWGDPYRRVIEAELAFEQYNPLETTK